MTRFLLIVGFVAALVLVTMVAMALCGLTRKQRQRRRVRRALRQSDETKRISCRRPAYTGFRKGAV